MFLIFRMLDGPSHRSDGWSEMRRQHFRNWVPSWDCYPSGRKFQGEGDEDVVSFYFSAFPNKSKARELQDLFGCIWEVVEVAIAPRRNKFGKKFRFVKFKDVEDAGLLPVKLDNVLIDVIKFT